MPSTQPRTQVTLSPSKGGKLGAESFLQQRNQRRGFKVGGEGEAVESRGVRTCSGRHGCRPSPADSGVWVRVGLASPRGGVDTRREAHLLGVFLPLPSPGPSRGIRLAPLPPLAAGPGPRPILPCRLPPTPTPKIPSCSGPGGATAWHPGPQGRPPWASLPPSALGPPARPTPAPYPRSLLNVFL